MSKRDYYKVLDVARTASEADILIQRAEAASASTDGIIVETVQNAGPLGSVGASLGQTGIVDVEIGPVLGGGHPRELEPRQNPRQNQHRRLAHVA